MVWVPYLEYYTSSNNLYFSEINDTYILKEDAEYSEEIKDYIFKQYDKNDEVKYNERKEYIKKKEEEREKSKKVKEHPSMRSFHEYFNMIVPERYTHDGFVDMFFDHNIRNSNREVIRHGQTNTDDTPDTPINVEF